MRDDQRNSQLFVSDSSAERGAWGHKDGLTGNMPLRDALVRGSHRIEDYVLARQSGAFERMIEVRVARLDKIFLGGADT